MAWLTQRGKTFYVAFRIGEKQIQRSLKTTNRRQAEAAAHRIEENLRAVENGQTEIPDGADITTFLLSDGHREKAVTINVAPNLSSIFDEYLESLPDGALEERTIKTTRTHMKHIFECYGHRIVFASLDTKQLQAYVNRRARKKSQRGTPISGTTIRKELATLRMLWSFARDREYVSKTFPMRGVRFPKVDAKEPFKTHAEISRRIARGSVSAEKQELLWECLFLTLSEVNEFLDYVQEYARHSFLYPMVVAAAHTGARRSELVRSSVDDFDLDGNTVTIRERKRNREQRTTRVVRMSSRLKSAMQDWLADHPGGEFAFYAGKINRAPSKTIDGPTVDQAHYHMRETLATSPKWCVVRGWHVLRHSFASNLASEGVDQRIIDSWMGHQTAEMRKRYQHLIPDAQQTAMDAVFG